MTDINLTQSDADALIGLAKYRIDDTQYDYPELGGSISVPLTSKDRKEHFILDISRGRIDLSKGTYQNRGRQAIVLVRLDFGGPPHRNPDGEEIGCPHLHVYREGYGDKWAVPVPFDRFLNLTDNWQTLEDFMRYCNVVKTPSIQWRLCSHD